MSIVARVAARPKQKMVALPARPRPAAPPLRPGPVPLPWFQELNTLPRAYQVRARYVISETVRKGLDASLRLERELIIIRSARRMGLRLDDNDGRVQQAGYEAAKDVHGWLMTPGRFRNRADLNAYLTNKYGWGVPTAMNDDDAWRAVLSPQFWTKRLRRNLSNALHEVARALGNVPMGDRYLDQWFIRRDADRIRALKNTSRKNGDVMKSVWELCKNSPSRPNSPAAAARYFEMRQGMHDLCTEDLGLVPFNATISAACVEQTPTYGTTLNPQWSEDDAKTVMHGINERLSMIRDCARHQGVPLIGDVHIEKGIRGLTPGLPHLHLNLYLRKQDTNYVDATFERLFPSPGEYKGGVTTGGQEGADKWLRYSGEGMYARDDTGTGKYLRTEEGDYVDSEHTRFCRSIGTRQLRTWGLSSKEQ